MYIIGIDPGLHGAVAILGVRGVYLGLHDTPTIHVPKIGARKAHSEYHAGAMAKLLEPYAELADTVVCIEESQAMPGQGLSSTWKTGYGFGIWVGVICALGMRHERIRPAKWKKSLGLTSDKEACRLRAIQLFPCAPLARKCDHDRAEALLLGWYAASVLCYGVASC